ncbi:hypothetical protein MKX01_001091 [Papaver californicum]|nr:hypothetical protein MKX01_001091 [Papaver californicum]
MESSGVIPTKQTHVAILTSPCIGHIIPCLELSLFLSPQSSTLQNNQDGLNVINLPPIDIKHIVAGETSLVVRITTIVHESLRSLRSIIETSQELPTVLIIDLFSTDALDIADEFKMSKYMFCTSNTSAYAFLAYLPKIKRVKNNNDFVSRLTEFVHVPGCKPIRVGLLADPNTDNLEQETYRALIDDDIAQLIPTPCVYPVGPIIKPTVGPSQNQAIHCFSWLDNQPNGSVLFVSFGSGGSLSSEQVTELAFGLELSQQRFIWVVRNVVNLGSRSRRGRDLDTLTMISRGDYRRNLGLTIKSFIQILYTCKY